VPENKDLGSQADAAVGGGSGEGRRRPTCGDVDDRPGPSRHIKLN
jgi:hypothetical protein